MNNPNPGEYWYVMIGGNKLIQRVIKFAEDKVWMSPVNNLINQEPLDTPYGIDCVTFVEEF